MKKIIYAIILVFIFACNKKEENNEVKVSKIENIKSLQDTMTKLNLDTISKESAKEGLYLEKKILGDWELIEYDFKEENEGDQEKSSGVTWIFKSNHICEERSEPSNPNNVTIYEYKISQKGCEITQDSKKFFYIKTLYIFRFLPKKDL